MKRYIDYLLLTGILSLFFSFIGGTVEAQDRNRVGYLKGAVPTENGKVVFRQSFDVPGICRDSLMELTRVWINERNNEQEERQSRILIFDNENGTLAGGCREKLVFKSTFLSLDQAEINYTLHATCSDGAVDMAIIRIRYDYGEDRRYTAEEIITDEVSLGSNPEKIAKSSEKWRVKTIDFAKNLFGEYCRFLAQEIGQPVGLHDNGDPVYATKVIP